MRGSLDGGRRFIAEFLVASPSLGRHPTEGGCTGGDQSTDTSYHRCNSSLEDWDAALWPRLQTALVVMGFKLNPHAVEFFPVLGHRREKRADWRWTSVSKQQIRYAEGDERCGRRRGGLLNPLGGETHKQGMYLDRSTKQKISNRKKRLARKGGRRARPERRRNAKTSQNVARARSRTGELNVATWNVRPLPLTGRRGAGHAEVLLQKYKVLGCDVIGLQETQRPGRAEFAAAGYRVFCSGVDGSSGRAGQNGMGLAVKESIIREATWTQELTNKRLMSMTFNLTGKSNAVTFVVAYGPTDTLSNAREQKDVF